MIKINKCKLKLVVQDKYKLTVTINHRQKNLSNFKFMKTAQNKESLVEIFCLMTVSEKGSAVE